MSTIKNIIIASVLSIGAQSSVMASGLDIFGQAFIGTENNQVFQKLVIQPTEQAMIIDISINNGDCQYKHTSKEQEFPYLAKKNEKIKLDVQANSDIEDDEKFICDVNTVKVFTMTGEYELNF